MCPYPVALLTGLSRFHLYVAVNYKEQKQIVPDGKLFVPSFVGIRLFLRSY
jgi:hypothetical protein